MNPSMIVNLLVISSLIWSVHSQPPLLELVLQWQYSYCNTADRVTDPCVAEVAPKFTVHGLWGYNSGGQSIRGSFSAGRIDDYGGISQVLEAKLRRYWPNLRAGADNNWLWDHEWSDHGSGLFSAPVDYLEEAVNLFEKVKADLRGMYVHDVLRVHNLVPGPTARYPPQRFADVLSQVTNSKVKVNLNCNRDKQSRLQLYEITFCADSDGELRNCTSQNNSNCNQERRVYFPAPEEPSPLQIVVTTASKAAVTLGSIVLFHLFS